MKPVLRLWRGRENALGGGWAAWLLRRFAPGGGAGRRLELLERIPLGPKQTLSLIEADGRRFLVAAAGDGTPAFYPLEETAHAVPAHSAAAQSAAARPAAALARRPQAAGRA